jgi:hypothetical protein
MGIRVASRAAAAAGESRSSFVDYVLNDFVARTRIAVSDEVRNFILADVLQPDDAWVKGLQANALDPDLTWRILTEALDVAAKRRPEGAELGISSIGTSGEGAFYQVIHDHWNCPFPFIFC